MKKFAIYLSLILLTKVHVQAQTDPAFSNYFLTRSWQNPGMIGRVPNQWKATILHRSQWSNVENSPSTQILAAEADVQRLGGVGIFMSNDNLGYERINTLNIGFSRKVDINKFTLSIGTSFGIINRKLDGSSLRYKDPDPNAITTDDNELTPDFNVGTVLSYGNFTASAAIKHIVNSSWKNDFFKVARQASGEVSYLAKVSPNLTVEPSVLYKTSGFISAFRFSTLLELKDRYMAGISYETNRSASFYLGIKINSKLQINYAFDKLMTGSSVTKAPAHEFALTYRFMKYPVVRMLSPRFL